MPTRREFFSFHYEQDVCELHASTHPADYETFRSELFAAADLPADPDDTWSDFIEAGETYRQHLVVLGAHDVDRCLYCRQPLQEPARDLIARYSTYLEDKISADIRTTDTLLAEAKRQVAGIQSNELVALIDEYKDEDDKPAYLTLVEAIERARSAVAAGVDAGKSVDLKIVGAVAAPKADVNAALTTVGTNITGLETQLQNRTQMLGEKQTELLELTDAVELGKSWSLIEAQVKSAKEADRLKTLKRPLPSMARTVTELAKTASDRMINQSFDALFLEECDALRAPALKLQFVGREGEGSAPQSHEWPPKAVEGALRGGAEGARSRRLPCRGAAGWHHRTRDLRRPRVQPRPPPD